MKKNLNQQSPRIAIASYFATFDFFSAILSQILVRKKTENRSTQLVQSN